MKQISDSELEIMKVIWESKEMTSSQIVKKISAKSEWKPKTIQTLIKRLVEKEAIEVVDTKNKTFVYRAKISEEDYKKTANSSFVDKLYNGSISMMLTSFVKNNKISKKDVEELKKMLEEE